MNKKNNFKLINKIKLTLYYAGLSCLSCQVYAMDKLKVDNVTNDLYKNLFTLINNNASIWMFLCALFGAVITPGKIEARAFAAVIGFITSTIIWTVSKQIMGI